MLVFCIWWKELLFSDEIEYSIGSHSQHRILLEPMPETYILIPGRTSKQGTTLNEGKYTEGYIKEINTLIVSPEDMEQLGVSEGEEVRMWNDVGEVTLPCKAAKGDDLPPGILFISYGDASSKLMGSDTQGSGMPDSKAFDVFLEKV